MKVNSGRRRVIGTVMMGAGAALLPRNGFAQKTAPLDISIVNTAGTTQHAFEVLLRRQGYLEEFGVNATTTNVADGSTIMAALIGGTADVCMASGFGQVLPGVAHGADVKIIAGGDLLVAQGVMTNRPDVKSITDLKGKTIATGALGALEHQLMVAVLSRHNVDLNTVHFVNVGNVTDIYRALVAGQVDAGPVGLDAYDRVKGNLKIIGNLWAELPDFPYIGSYTSTATIAKKREALVRTLAAYAKMYRFLLSPESKQPYIDSYVQSVGGAGAAVAATRLWQFYFDTKGYATKLVIPEKSLNFTQALNIQTGTQKAALPIARFSDMYLAREAVARLG